MQRNLISPPFKVNNTNSLIVICLINVFSAVAIVPYTLHMQWASTEQVGGLLGGGAAPRVRCAPRSGQAPPDSSMDSSSSSLRSGVSAGLASSCKVW